MDDASRIFDSALARLAAAGLPRPASCTVRRYLEGVAAAGLLPPGAGERFADLLERSQHSPDGIDARQAAVAAREIEAAAAAIDPDDPRIGEALRRLQSAPRAAPSVRRVATTDGVNRLDPTPTLEEATAPDDREAPAPTVATAAAPSTARRRPRRTLLAIACLVVAAAVGHFGGEPLIDVVRSGAARTLGWRIGDPHRLEALRETAATRPDDAGVWLTLVAEARRLDRWGDVVLGLEHLLARDPDNAGLLNELAWLRLTGPDPWLRDPVQALALARRAYALDPSPHIADTLAEAEFQNGSPERAIELEERAIEQVGGNDEFYRRQLDKFRRAVQQRSP